MTCSSATKNAAQRLSAPSRVRSGAGYATPSAADENAARPNGHGPPVRLNLAVLLTVVVVIAARFMWIYPAADSALTEPIACTAGPASALAVAFLSCVCRRDGRRFASSGNCTPFPLPAFALVRRRRDPTVKALFSQL